MFSRLLEMFGFRKSDTAEEYVAKMERLSREQRAEIIDAYTKEDVSAVLPDEHISQTALRLWRAGQRQAALEFYNQAIAIAPDDAVLPLNRGNLQFELGNINEALADFERAKNGQPRLPEHLFATQTLLQAVSPQTIQALIEKRKSETRAG